MTNEQIDTYHNELNAKAKPVAVVEHKKLGRRSGKLKPQAPAGYRTRPQKNFKVSVIKKKKYHVGGKTDTGDMTLAPRWMINKITISEQRRDKRNKGDKRYERLKSLDEKENVK